MSRVKEILTRSALSAALLIPNACGPSDTEKPVKPGQTIATGQHEDEKNLRKRILDFSLSDLSNPERTARFIREAANLYVQLSGSARFDPTDLASPNHLMLVSDRNAFVAEVKKLQPEANPPEGASAYTHFPSRKILFDLGTFHNIRRDMNDNVGQAMLHVFFHEYTHIDLDERTEGAFLNNPNVPLTPQEGESPIWLAYQGGSIRFSDGTEFFRRFEEVFVDTIVYRRLSEQIGLSPTLSMYHTVGLDFFLPLTKEVGLSIDDLYKLHSTSDLEGLASKIGSQLQGPASAHLKGLGLFLGIDFEDTDIVIRSGVFHSFPQIYPGNSSSNG